MIFLTSTFLHSLPSGHQTSFVRPMDVYMKLRLHIDDHWTSKRRVIPLGGEDIVSKVHIETLAENSCWNINIFKDKVSRNYCLAVDFWLDRFFSFFFIAASASDEKKTLLELSRIFYPEMLEYFWYPLVTVNSMSVLSPASHRFGLKRISCIFWMSVFYKKYVNKII